jgi:antitoxin HicB
LIRLPALIALKVELCRTLSEQQMTRAELGRRLDWNRESVDRLFRLDHSFRLEQIEAAFSALGQRVDVAIHKVA